MKKLFFLLLIPLMVSCFEKEDEPQPEPVQPKSDCELFMERIHTYKYVKKDVGGTWVDSVDLSVIGMKTPYGKICFPTLQEEYITMNDGTLLYVIDWNRNDTIILQNNYILVK